MLQPVCVTSIDAAQARYTLPAPTHVRVAAGASAAAVIRGAAQTLAQSTMKSILVPEDTARDAVAASLPDAWTTSAPGTGATPRVLLRRDATMPAALDR